MRKAKNSFHVSIDMAGSRGRKLDIIATTKKASRCEALAAMIDETYNRITGELESDVPNRSQ
jgi:hypothetical protein